MTDVAQVNATDALDGMGWRGFEMLVGEGFRLQGYQVAETGGGGADGGVDRVLTRPGRNGAEKFLVQCKQWRALKVGVDVVREPYGLMAARGAPSSRSPRCGGAERQLPCHGGNLPDSRGRGTTRRSECGGSSTRPPPERRTSLAEVAPSRVKPPDHLRHARRSEVSPPPRPYRLAHRPCTESEGLVHSRSSREFPCVQES